MISMSDQGQRPQEGEPADWSHQTDGDHVDSFIKLVVEQTQGADYDESENPFSDLMLPDVDTSRPWHLMAEQGLAQLPATAAPDVAPINTANPSSGFHAGAQANPSVQIQAYEPSPPVAPNVAQPSADEGEDEAQDELYTIYNEWCKLSLKEVQALFLKKMKERFENVSEYDNQELIRLMSLPAKSLRIMELMQLRLTGSEPVKRVAPLYFDFARYRESHMAQENKGS